MWRLGGGGRGVYEASGVEGGEVVRASGWGKRDVRLGWGREGREA